MSRRAPSLRSPANSFVARRHPASPASTLVTSGWALVTSREPSSCLFCYCYIPPAASRLLRSVPSSTSICPSNITISPSSVAIRPLAPSPQLIVAFAIPDSVQMGPPISHRSYASSSTASHLTHGYLSRGRIYLIRPRTSLIRPRTPLIRSAPISPISRATACVSFTCARRRRYRRRKMKASYRRL